MAFVSRHAPHAERGFEKYTAIGVERNGKLIAGVVYSNFHGFCIDASIASIDPRWASRKVLQVLFAYPFIQCKVKRLGVITGKTMTDVRLFLERLGFKQEGIARNGFDDDDAVLYGMLPEECRWINHEQGKQQSSSPDSARL